MSNRKQMVIVDPEKLRAAVNRMSKRDVEEFIEELIKMADDPEDKRAICDKLPELMLGLKLKEKEDNAT